MFQQCGENGYSLIKDTTSLQYLQSFIHSMNTISDNFEELSH